MLVIAGLVYLEFRKPDIIERTENWYNENHPGTIAIGDFDISPFYEFPALSLKINQVKLVEHEDSTNNHRHIEVDQILVHLDFGKLLKKKVELKSIVFQDATVAIIDSIPTSGTKQLKRHPHVSEAEKLQWLEYLEKQPIKLALKNIDFKFLNLYKDKDFSGKINEVNSTFRLKDKIALSHTTLDLVMDKMGFDTKKGTFFNTAQLQGKLSPSFDLENQELDIPSFKLQIDQQDFFVGGKLNFGEKGFYDIELTNAQTNYLASKALLSQDIQKKMDLYEVEQPIHTFTKIQGKFRPGSQPLVQVDFKTSNNTAIIDSVYVFDSLSFHGRLANSIYDKNRPEKESTKNFKIVFEKANGQYRGVPFELKESFFRTTARVKNYIHFDAMASGEAERFNEILGTTDFIFQSGTFDIQSKFSRAVNRPEDVLKYITADLKIKKPKIYQRKLDLILPVRNLNLQLDNEAATVNQLKIRLPENQEIVLNGTVDNFYKLIVKNEPDTVSSSIHLSSKKLTYQAINQFLTPLKHQSKKNPKKSLDTEQIRQVLADIYERFQPALTIQIDDFAYQDYQISDYQTNLSFLNQNTIQLTDAEFLYPKGKAKLAGVFSFPKDELPLADFYLNANGKSSGLNDILKNNTFFFQDGDYNLDLTFNHSINASTAFWTKGEVDFQMNKNTVFIPESQLSIPIDSISLFVKNDTAFLNQIVLPVSLKDQVTLDGQLNNYSTLLFDDQLNKPIDADIHIHTKHIRYDDFISYFDRNTNNKNNFSPKNKNLKPNSSSTHKLSKTLTTIHKKFNPKLKITVDSFHKNEIYATDFQSIAILNPKQKLIIKKSGFEIDGGHTLFHGKIDYRYSDRLPATLELTANGNAQQFNQLFNNQTFIFEDGNFWVDVQYNGDLLKGEKILDYIDCDLTMNKVKVNYADMNLHLPLKSLHVILDDGNAIVRDFKLPLQSGNLIEIDGRVNNFGSLLLDSIAQNVNSRLNIYSADLDFQDLARLFDVNSPSDDSDTTKTTQIQNVFKSTVKGIYQKFNPSINLIVDDFSYRTFNVQNIKTGVFFHNKNLLDLKQTSFNLGKTYVGLDASLDLSKDETTHFSTDFNAQKMEVERLVQVFDYFNLPSLREAENVTGILSSEGILSGDVFDQTGKLDTTMQGTIQFALEDLRLQNFGPILSTAGKIFNDKRLKDIRFAPITNTINIARGDIKIPQLEITSTAFNFFVEGNLRYDDNTHIWVSVPWSNLWFRDYEKVPEKKSYNESGIKFFIQAKGEENGGMDYKFRFTNRKWYKSRGLLHLYRKQKRRERKQRRKYQREKRRNDE